MGRRHIMVPYRSVSAVAVAACLFLPSATTIVSAQSVVQSELISYDRLTNATGGDDLPHEFTEKPDRVRVTVRCKLKRGTFAFRVEDPDGEVVWKQELGGKSSVDLADEFQGQAGKWRIVLDYAKAKGKYHIKMEAVDD